MVSSEGQKKVYRAYTYVFFFNAVLLLGQSIIFLYQGGTGPDNGANDGTRVDSNQRHGDDFKGSGRRRQEEDQTYSLVLTS